MELTLRRPGLFGKGDFLRHLVLIVLLGITFYPFIAMLIISVKDTAQFMHHTWTLSFPLHWENYAYAWEAIKVSILNSILISGASCIGVIVLSALSAYAFARFRFKGKEVLYMLIISLLMIPGILTLIPSFMLVKHLGLIDSRLVLILPYVAGGQIIAIFLMRPFFASISEDLFEAARLDGATEWQILMKIVIPMSRSIIGTVAVMNVLSTWNDLVWPLITISNPELQTLTVRLAFFRNEYYTLWGPLMAGYVISSVPLIILFAVASNLFIQGMSSGSVKM